MEKTIDSILKINAADHQIKQIMANLYYHVLNDYVANANRDKVLDGLYEFYTKSDLTLISKQQLRVYQELEKHSLSLSAFDIRKKIENG